MKVRFLDDAHDDGAEAARWYERRQSGLGDDFLDLLTAVNQTIEGQPDRR